MKYIYTSKAFNLNKKVFLVIYKHILGKQCCLNMFVGIGLLNKMSTMTILYSRGPPDINLIHNLLYNNGRSVKCYSELANTTSSYAGMNMVHISVQRPNDSGFMVFPSCTLFL